MPHLCPSGQGYPGMGWSEQSVGWPWPERVGVLPEGSRQWELGHRVVGERCGTPHLPHSSDPFGL